MKIAVLTSGGDAPGMNAAIRAVVRSAIFENMKIIGIQNGYQGLVEKKIIPLNLRSVANLVQRGGTFLKTGRYPDFLKEDVRQTAIKNFRSENIKGLICIGGNGSFKGAICLAKESDILVVGIPATIDNDICNTNFTIGFDTAVNTALQAIDRIRDTAESHERLFLVEVMGRTSDFIALYVGLASGAEDVVLYGQKDFTSVLDRLRQSERKGKKSRIVVVSEGEVPGKVYELSKVIEEKLKIKSRVCVLGHIQRGGSPSALDRVLAALMGDKAVKALKNKENLKMVSMEKYQILLTSLEEAVSKRKETHKTLCDLVHKLAN